MQSVTLSIPEELKLEMKKHPEVNWAEVARAALLSKAAKLRLLKSIVAKSKLTEKDALELGRGVNKSLHERYEKLYKEMK